MTFHPKTASIAQLPACLSAHLCEPGLAFVNDVLALRPALLAFARRLATQDCDAEDLVQDTVLRALAARHQFTGGTNLKSWLFTIMRNRFNSGWRKAKREVTTGSDVIELTMVTPATQENLLWAQQAAGHLLHDLSPAHREILILILILVPVRGLSYEEAARICGCSVGTVKSRLNRARAALSVLVEGE